MYGALSITDTNMKKILSFFSKISQNNLDDDDVTTKENCALLKWHIGGRLMLCMHTHFVQHYSTQISPNSQPNWRKKFTTQSKQLIH